MEVLFELSLQIVDILENLSIRPLAGRQVFAEGKEFHSSHSSQVGLWSFLDQVLEDIGQVERMLVFSSRVYPNVTSHESLRLKNHLRAMWKQ